MANAIYPLYYQELLRASANVDIAAASTGTTGTFCALVDTGTYTYSAAHQFYSSLSGIVGTDQEITTKTNANGVFDGDDLTYTSVSGASVEALVIYRKNAGANTTWRLIAYLDTSQTGLPVTPNGGNITVTWNASGILKFSDRNLKENIREIGHLHGVLPIYEYNYNGERQRHVGLMAQDVEKIAPNAVVSLRSRKAVHYGRAIAACERLAA